jgi:hypothetical protein
MPKTWTRRWSDFGNGRGCVYIVEGCQCKLAHNHSHHCHRHQRHPTSRNCPPPRQLTSSLSLSFSRSN